MSLRSPGSLVESFSRIDDPRSDSATRHDLMDIISIAICAVICGAEGWSDVELFGRPRHDWLKRFLKLPNGISSHDTFGRVSSLIDPRQFHWSYHFGKMTVVSERAMTLRIRR